MGEITERGPEIYPNEVYPRPISDKEVLPEWIEPDTTMKEVVEHTKKELIAKVTGPQGMLPDDHPLQPKTKRAPRNKAAKQVVKSSTVNQIMKGYEDKIALLLYADGGSEPETMGKEVRDLYLQYQKEKEVLKNKFIANIQKL